MAAAAAAATTGYNRDRHSKSSYYTRTSIMEHAATTHHHHHHAVQSSHYKYSTTTQVEVQDYNQTNRGSEKFPRPTPTSTLTPAPAPKVNNVRYIPTKGDHQQSKMTNSTPNLDTFVAELMKDAAKSSDHNKYYKKPMSTTNVITHREAAARYGGKLLETYASST